MAQRVVRRVPSANQKIVSVNKKFGNPNIGNQQGTTRIIYDAVPLITTTGATTATLFENCKTRQFPFTNLQENKLQKGESISMQRMWLGILNMEAGSITQAKAIGSMGAFPEFLKLYTSQISFSIGQNQVIKKMPAASLYAPFNKDAFFFQHYPVYDIVTGLPDENTQISQDVFHFDNPIIIPENIEFKMDVLMPPQPAIPAGIDCYLFCAIEGLGSLFAPKNTY